MNSIGRISSLKSTDSIGFSLVTSYSGVYRFWFNSKDKMIKLMVMGMRMILELVFMIIGLRNTRLLSLDCTNKYKLSGSIIKSHLIAIQ